MESINRNKWLSSTSANKQFVENKLKHLDFGRQGSSPVRMEAYTTCAPIPSQEIPIYKKISRVWYQMIHWWSSKTSKFATAAA